MTPPVPSSSLSAQYGGRQRYGRWTACASSSLHRCPLPDVSIHDIRQFTTNPNGDSPLVGRMVNTGGIVTTAAYASGYTGCRTGTVPGAASTCSTTRTLRPGDSVT